QIYMPQVMGGLGPEIPIVEFTRFASTPSNYMSNAWLVCSELIRNKIAVQVELELMRREIAQLRERMRELSSFTHLSFKAETDMVRLADIKVKRHNEIIISAVQWTANKKRRQEQIQRTKGSDSSVAQWIADKKRREEQTQQTKGSGSSVAETALS